MGSRGHLTTEGGFSNPGQYMWDLQQTKYQGHNISPRTANALVNVNPSELHIQQIICYRSYIILATDTYCNFHTKNIKNDHLRVWKQHTGFEIHRIQNVKQKIYRLYFSYVTIKYYWENIFFEISYIQRRRCSDLTDIFKSTNYKITFPWNTECGNKTC